MKDCQVFDICGKCLETEIGMTCSVSKVSAPVMC